LFAKSEGRRPVGRTRHKCGNNIETDLQLLICNGMDWMHVAFSFKHCNDLPNSIKLAKYLEQLSNCKFPKKYFAACSQLEEV
jgi:hypothetical protein